jgi:bifunctional NMN adenylyltransferase/nudix hydrolase
MENVHKIGVVIARFQVPSLHDGHLHLLEYVEDISDEMVIMLASPISSNIKNPLPYIIRREMVSDYGFINNTIMEIVDNPKDDMGWSCEVDRILEGFNGSITLYGSRDSFLPHYLGKHPTVFVDPVPSISGSEMRASVSYELNNTEDFRKGIIYALTELL